MELARTQTPDGPRVVVTSGARTVGAIATVDGRDFDDLPGLLDAADGEAVRIESGAEVELSEANMLSVVARPRKIIGIGLNYRAHAAETGTPLPDHPVVFPKWDNALAGPFDDVPLPPESTLVDWEAELAFVFCRQCRRVPAEDAASVVFGFTAANDLSMRDYQYHTSQWAPGKSWERGTAVGPVIVDTEQIGGVTPDLAVRGRRNGELVQDSRTADLLYGLPELVAYLSTFMTMEPGDLVLTGTPAGVGIGRTPPEFLAANDIYEVEIEGVGTIRNRFVPEAEWAPRA
jgi:acylpyruvate hydrolase